MQKHAKLEQKWKKVKNHENRRNSRLDVVPSRLDCRKSSGLFRLAATADWRVKPVDWIGLVNGIDLGSSFRQSTGKRRQSTGSNVTAQHAQQPSPAHAACTPCGVNSAQHVEAVDCVMDSRLDCCKQEQRINPSRRQREKTQIPTQSDFGKIITLNPEGIPR